MRLQELAEKIQQELEEGNLSFIIFQEGRQWKYERYGEGNNVSDEDVRRYLTIKNRIDDEVIIVNGKKDFDSYDLKFIQNQIKILRKKS